MDLMYSEVVLRMFFKVKKLKGKLRMCKMSANLLVKQNEKREKKLIEIVVAVAEVFTDK